MGVCERDHVEVHPKNPDYYGRWRKQTGNYRHHLHYLVHFKIHIADIKILDVHQDITIVFCKIVSLQNVIVYIFEILGIHFQQQVAFASDNSIDKIADRSNISFKYDKFFP